MKIKDPVAEIALKELKTLKADTDMVWKGPYNTYCRVPGNWGLQQKPSPKHADSTVTTI